MGDLEIVKTDGGKIVDLIYAAYEKRGDAEPERGYLGASIIGHSCSRYLWYCFRACVKRNFEGRMYRLFDTGDNEEARMVADLRSVGCEVHDCDEHGEQFEVNAIGGHFSGHMDGCTIGIPGAEKTWHVLEFKTHGKKSFAKLIKSGVKESKPQHYAQMQSYMHLTGMTRALYLAVEKDTDQLYAERVKYDKDFAESLMNRAEEIITASSPPERAFTRCDYYECKWCDALPLCWGNPVYVLPVPGINCRQCVHATPVVDSVGGAWSCSKHNRGLSKQDQQFACQDHLAIPALITIAEPTNYKNEETESVEYTTARGVKFWNGRLSGQWSSRELSMVSPSAIESPLVEDAKSKFGVRIVGQTVHPEIPF